MPKFRKRPIVIEATQWFKNGDHPQDDCRHIGGAETGAPHPQMYLSEGKVVRYYSHPEIPGTKVCGYCNNMMKDHGWIDTVQGGHTVCPGDWIITDDRVADVRGHGHYYPCKPDIFAATYEPMPIPLAEHPERKPLLDLDLGNLPLPKTEV